MSHLPKDWRFLSFAWLYALVLFGRQASASEKVSSILRSIASRHDVVSPRRRRRLFFAMLHRDGIVSPRLSEGEFEGNPELFAFHQMEEPGRSALVLFYLRLFPSEQLANILGRPEKELAEILSAARNDLSSRLPADT